MLGEKWDPSAPKGHNHKFPIWQHHPWTSAWDDDNHLFNSNKQSSVSLQQQAVFQKAAFCSDLIQVVSTAAEQCISKTTCKQEDSKASFFCESHQNKRGGGKQSGTVAPELASFSLLGISNTCRTRCTAKSEEGWGWQKALVAGLTHSLVYRSQQSVWWLSKVWILWCDSAESFVWPLFLFVLIRRTVCCLFVFTLPSLTVSCF